VPAPRRAGGDAALVDRLDALLPQTQCTRCGYESCRAYAVALAAGEAGLNQCPPGGAEGIARLARALGRAPMPLSPEHGAEGPRLVMYIDEKTCIGCTLCIQACPVDCIVGAPKRMHTIIESLCTGCELCLPVCPVDCILTETASGDATGWEAWSPALAAQARERFEARLARAERFERENAARLAAKAAAKLADLASHTRHTDPATIERKRAVIEAALARARERSAGGGRTGEGEGNGAA
jgi:electron transport complex protein RnfB